MVSTRWQHQKLRQCFKSVCDAADAADDGGGGGGDLVEPCWEDDDVTVTSSDDDGSSPMTIKLPGFSAVQSRPVQSGQVQFSHFYLYSTFTTGRAAPKRFTMKVYRVHTH